MAVECDHAWDRLAFLRRIISSILLLDAELRAKISDNKMLLNVLCCLVVFLAVQVFTNNTGLTCLISHIVLLSLAGINYFVYSVSW